ncbi:Synaptotagmin-2 [Coccomyxa sp. Obi]|nr:Synaptotagmin-2 [Coccomyxa sp. Obi]
MRHPQVFLVLLLIAACIHVSAWRDSNGSGGSTDNTNHGFRLADEEVARIASALGERSHSGKLSRGFGLFDFLLGIVVACGGAAFLEYRYNFRILNRKQKTQAIQALKDMDVHTLRQVLGNANLPSWINFPDFERVNWVNMVFTQLWPNLGAYFTKQAHPQLDPLLTQNKPSWIKDIKLIKFDLGEKAPHISGVKVYRVDNQTTDEVIMECDFMWAGQQDVQILVEPVPRIVSKALIGIGTVISKLIRLKVSVMRLIINGRVRITLTPLLNDMPIIGAIQVSLVEMPDFSFDLEVLGGDITLLPGLEAWLNSFVRQSVLRPYVLPDQYTVQLTDSALGIQTPKGILFVKLLEAEHVPKMDVLSKSDPYVKLGVRSSRMSRSQVIDNDLNPKWNEDFKLLVHEPEHQALRLELYDYDAMDNDDLIGEAKIDVKELENQEERDLWLEIKDIVPEKGSHKGLGGKLRAVRDVSKDAVDKTRRRLGREKSGKTCRVHLKVTYYEFKKEEVDAAMQGREEGRNSPQRVPSRVENKDAFNILMGGVLYVRGRKAHNLVHKPWYKGGILKSTATLKVTVAGHSKKTISAQGSEPLFDDTLEFILGADEIEEAERKQIEVEVWDYKLVNHFRGVAQVSLKDVLDNNRIRDTFRLKGVDHGELELEMQWFRVLDMQPSQ